jgi:hypothetical protein
VSPPHSHWYLKTSMFYHNKLCSPNTVSFGYCLQVRTINLDFRTINQIFLGNKQPLFNNHQYKCGAKMFTSKADNAQHSASTDPLNNYEWHSKEYTAIHHLLANSIFVIDYQYIITDCLRSFPRFIGAFRAASQGLTANPRALRHGPPQSAHRWYTGGISL